MSKRTLPVSSPIIFLLLIFLIGPAAVLQGNNPLLWLLCVLVVIAGGTWLITRAMIRGIRVHRRLPPHAVAGAPANIGYEIAQSHRLVPAFDITIREQDARPGSADADERSSPAWILHVGPRQRVHGEGLLVPRRRGRLQLGTLEIRTGFPLGIVPRRRLIVAPQDLLVYPEIRPLRDDLLRALVGLGTLGRRGVNRHGDGLDYFGTRTVRQGDGFRDIAWKTSARRDQLVAIERSQPESPRLRVVLDLSVPTRELQVGHLETASARELEEQAISLAASLLREASARGYEAGLQVLGVDGPRHQIRGGVRHVDRMMADLAEIDLDGPRSSSSAIAERERAGLVIIHPDRVRQHAARRDAWHLTARQLSDLVVSETPPEEAAA